MNHHIQQKSVANVVGDDRSPRDKTTRVCPRGYGGSVTVENGGVVLPERRPADGDTQRVDLVSGGASVHVEVELHSESEV
jgi:hypothetical protein